MIYLDNNATTVLDPRVLEAMLPFFKQLANPSSIHRLGQKARGALLSATQEIATFFGVRPRDLCFCSGATEGLNMVIRSAAEGTHIISSSLEHAAVLAALKETKCTVTFIDPIPQKGALTLQQIQEAVRPNTSMIVLTAANNETGVLTDIESVAHFALQKRIALVVDGVALLGKETFVIPSGVSAICFSGHKIHGPLGIGLVVLKSTFRLRPLIVGGPQQHGMRGGTENIPSIVGFAKALSILKEEQNESLERMRFLRDRLEELFLEEWPYLVIHGRKESRVSNTSNIAFPGVDAETLFMQLDLQGIAVSHGSACSSGAWEPSRVLQNMGIPLEIVKSSLRFSLSRYTTLEEIETVAREIISIVNLCKKSNSLNV